MGHLGRMLLEILHMFVEGFWVEKVYKEVYGSARGLIIEER